MSTNVTETMDYYADDLKDPDRVESVYKVLNEKGFIEKSAHMAPLINVFLSKVYFSHNITFAQRFKMKVTLESKLYSIFLISKNELQMFMIKDVLVLKI